MFNRQIYEIKTNIVHLTGDLPLPPRVGHLDDGTQAVAGDSRARK